MAPRIIPSISQAICYSMDLAIIWQPSGNNLTPSCTSASAVLAPSCTFATTVLTPFGTSSTALVTYFCTSATAGPSGGPYGVGGRGVPFIALATDVFDALAS